MIKICRKCNTEKEFSMFFKNEARCKECENKRRLEYSRTKEGLITKIYGAQKCNSKNRGHSKPTYSKKWLSSWLLSNPEFHRLYDMWVTSGYEKNIIPSIDRIDDYVGYTEYNIQLTVWHLNEKRGNKDRVNGINNKKSRAVTQFTKDNRKVRTYFSAVEARRVTGIDNSDINKVCKGKNKTAGGFIWKYAKEVGDD